MGNIFLKFVPPQLLKKNCFGKLAMNSEIWKYPSTVKKSGATRYKQINGGRFSVRLLYGFLMQQICILGMQNRPLRNQRHNRPLQSAFSECNFHFKVLALEENNYS